MQIRMGLTVSRALFNNDTGGAMFSLIMNQNNNSRDDQGQTPLMLLGRDDLDFGYK